MKPLAPNSLIQNRYLVVQLIGKGGMGEVYLAVDQRLGSAVALKRTFFSDDEALRNAFEREAKMLARLRHSALTKVSDHFTEDNLQYLVMEHISGDDLGQRLEQNKKAFPLSWVLFWADQLLDALTYLHSHEPPIIHRDIKPQNLKLTNENHIILLDFGLAKTSVGETRLSTDGSLIAYTPNYASMEQIRGTGTTARSDIYSLSATMYQLLTNSVPLDALTRADAVLNNMPDPVKPLSEVNPEVSSVVSNVISKGFSLSAEQRFPSAKEMQIALREAYSQVQQGLSGHAVALNASGIVEKQETPVASQSNLKTEQFSAPVKNEPIGEKTEVMPKNLVWVGDDEPTTNQEVPTPPIDFGATVPFVSIPLAVEITEVLPIEVSAPAVEKTEVMQFELPTPWGEKTAVMPKDIASTPEAEKTEVLPPEISNQIQQNWGVNEAESLKPEATVPVVYHEQVSELPGQATSDFASIKPEDSQTESFAAQPVFVKTETTTPKPNPLLRKKAGRGKLYAVIGVLFGLAILGMAGAGVGLYILKPEIFTSATPAPTPRPTAEPTVAPSMTPTPEPTLEANTNPGNSSTELTTANTSNTNASETPEIVEDKTPRSGDKTQPTPVRQIINPTPQVVRDKTPAPKTPIPVKVTPAKKPTVDTTKILQ